MSMITEEYLKTHFYPKAETLDRDIIEHLNSTSENGNLSNVVRGLKSNFFGVIDVNKTTLDYTLVHVNNDKELCGECLTLNVLDKERDRLLYIFCSNLSEWYNLDFLNTINVLQDLTRSMCEMLGIHTISSDDLEQFKDVNGELVLLGNKRLLLIRFIYHIDIYKYMFGELTAIDSQLNGSYIYLMHDAKNNLTKIGRSIKPGHREKTLQSEEPKITMIAFWKLDKNVESNLHKKYKPKRVRGEWFNLSFKELEEIKEYLDELVSNSN